MTHQAKLSSIFIWTASSRLTSSSPALTFWWNVNIPDSPIPHLCLRSHGQAMPSLSIPGIRPWPSRALGDMLLPGKWVGAVMKG